MIGRAVGDRLPTEAPLRSVPISAVRLDSPGSLPRGERPGLFTAAPRPLIGPRCARTAPRLPALGAARPRACRRERGQGATPPVDPRRPFGRPSKRVHRRGSTRRNLPSVGRLVAYPGTALLVPQGGMSSRSGTPVYRDPRTCTRAERVGLGLPCSTPAKGQRPLPIWSS